jgi:hypothetical protein
LKTLISPSISCVKIGKSGVCTSTGGLLACAEFTPVLFACLADSPLLASSPAESVLADANNPAPANALRMNPRLLLMFVPSQKNRNRAVISENNCTAAA